LNNDVNPRSRAGHRAKRKKTNIILNGLIGLVLILIIIVGYSIFASPGSDKASSKKNDNPISAEKSPQKKGKDNKKASKEVKQADQSSASAQQNGDSTTTTTGQDDSSQADTSKAVVSNGGSSPNVVKTIENPAWKPVGTTQSGPHTPVYDQSSTDWQEMLNAISYATGLDQSNMIVYFLGRDKSTANASVGTVYSKDKQQKYKVYIKWVDGQGWQPTKVEELSSLQ
jgi:hypothetical protein